MPQLTLEYTDNIGSSVEFDLLFARFHEILSEVAGIRIENCKSRAVKLTEYHIGRGDADGAFVHVDVAILSGRPIETREEIGRRMLELLRDSYARPLGELDLQVTVEVRDMGKDLYFKIPEGTLTP